MNPLDLPGPEFLLLFMALILAALVAGLAIHWSSRLPAGDPPAEALHLAPYEIAYLAGPEVVVEAAVARLVNDGYVEVLSGDRWMKGHEVLTKATDVERDVHEAVNAGPIPDIRVLVAQARPALDPIRHRLENLGLIMSQSRIHAARLYPILLVLAVVLFGVLKILVGLSRNRPVLFLILLCITAVVAAARFWLPLHRTVRGDKALAHHREVNAAVEFQAERRLHQMSGDDVILAMGLFGSGVFAAGPIAQLEKRFHPKSKWGFEQSSIFDPGGWSLSDGGGGDGGGCGGGGCGGCGG